MALASVVSRFGTAFTEPYGNFNFGGRFDALFFHGVKGTRHSHSVET